MDAIGAAEAESSLERLVRLAVADEGFFVLALHSFVESRARAECPPPAPPDEFPELLRAFSGFLASRGVPVERLAPLARIAKEHALAEGVRRAFARLDAEEALAATHNFLAFCDLCGIASPALAPLRERLQAWEDTRLPFARGPELRRALDELAAARRDAPRPLERFGTAGPTAPPAADVERYLENLSRFTLYARTRRDFERSPLRLTPAQREAADEIRPGHDFLIRGGAGTGKTVVLLHAFARTRRERDTELGFGRPARMALLASTATRVKHARKVATELRAAGVEDLVTTADDFFLARLRRIEARARVDEGIVARLTAQLNDTGFLTDRELAAEIEDFLFANAVTREEYLDDVVLRRGMRQPLSAKQRAHVWDVRARAIDGMERAGTPSRNWSRIRLIEHLARTPGDPDVCDVDLAFVDDAQDLTAVDLKALKALTRRSLVLAGSAGEAISGVGSPFRRAGIDISGRTRVLHASLRTTRPIQATADRYRALDRREGDEPDPQAFREGPAPELCVAATRDELDSLLLAHVALSIDALGYDPGDVAVLVPARGDVARTGRLLASAGRAGIPILDEAFSFGHTGAVRLAALRDSTGLDFPVVLLYLPGPPSRDDGETAGDTLARELICAAMTSAMDDLCVFTLEAPGEKPLADLAALLREPATP